MKNTNSLNLGWMTTSMVLHTAAASALVFASFDATNTSQHQSLKQQQLIEFQVQDENVQQQTPAASENVEKNIPEKKSTATADRQLAATPAKNKITTLPSKKVSSSQSTQNKITTETEPEPKYVVMAPEPLEKNEPATAAATAPAATEEKEILEEQVQQPSAIASNSTNEEALDIPEPQPVEVKNSTPSQGPAIAINGNQDTASNVRTLEQLKQAPGNEVPKYDNDDRLHKRQGDVTFWAYVNKQGTLEKFKLIESTGFRELDFKTLRVLRSWKFYPGQEGWVEIPYSWSLKGEAQIKPTTLRRSSEL